MDPCQGLDAVAEDQQHQVHLDTRTAMTSRKSCQCSVHFIKDDGVNGGIVGAVVANKHIPLYPSSMSKVIDVSHKLGQYMLSGWILTDMPCKNSGCHGPLIRSPQGRLPVTHFCPNCDDDPDASSSSSESKKSRTSTPPTETSNLSESPPLAPVIDTDEIRRHREQSDRASHEIGNRLLQGWTMLADECPGPTCYGVPLVRPPRPGNEKDPRKECVICRTVYVSDVDPTGRRHLTSSNVNDRAPSTSHAGTYSNSNSKVTLTLPDVMQSGHSIAAQFAASSHSQPIDTTYGGTEILRTLETSSKSLQTTLHMLSMQLVSFSAQSIPADPTSVSSTADAVLKVTQALSQVRQLEWSERQVRSLQRAGL